MKKVLRLSSVVFLVALFFSIVGFSNVSLASPNINVEINGEQVYFDEPPFMQNDRILVPVRAIAEKMQFEVNYEEATRKIFLSNFNTEITMYENNNSIRKVPKYLMQYHKERRPAIIIDTPPFIKNGSIFVPLRAIAELFNSEVNWVEEINTAKVKHLDTFGDIVTFEDKSFEQLCRIAITIIGLNWEIAEPSIFRDINSNRFNPYDGPFYEGLAQQVTSIWFKDVELPKHLMVSSINDISKLPNLRDVYLLYQNISELSPIIYKSEWRNIHLYGNPILDYTPMTKVLITESASIGISKEGKFSFKHNFYGLQNLSHDEYVNLAPNYQLSEKEKQEYYSFISDVSQIFNIMRNAISEKEITADMTDRQKINLINDWIHYNVTYDKETITIAEGNTIKTTILQKKAVCGGYSRVFQMFCTMLNIKCIFLYGELGNTTNWVPHGWNVVEIDGKREHVDVTNSENFESDILIFYTPTFNEYSHRGEIETIDPLFEEEVKYGWKTLKLNKKIQSEMIEFFLLEKRMHQTLGHSLYY